MADKHAFFFQKDTILVSAEANVTSSSLEMPCASVDLPVLDEFTVPALSGGKEYSCIKVAEEALLPAHLQALSVRQALALLSGLVKDAAGPLAGMLRAYHIAQWRRESLFCGSCGCENSDSPGEAARLCPRCGRMEFPRITPTVITLITNDEGRVLLAHNKKFPPGMYSLIAGFAEAGESLEAAVARETREEVQIEVCDIAYVVSQSWPFPNSLMTGFTARHAGGIIKPDGDEIEDARWFSKDDLPIIPNPGSVARLLIDKWLGARG